MSVLRLDGPGEVAFMPIKKFDSLDAIRASASERYEEAVVPEQARATALSISGLNRNRLRR
jgi:hypothetical protein